MVLVLCRSVELTVDVVWASSAGGDAMSSGSSTTNTRLSGLCVVVARVSAYRGRRWWRRRGSSREVVRVLWLNVLQGLVRLGVDGLVELRAGALDGLRAEDVGVGVLVGNVVLCGDAGVAA